VLFDTHAHLDFYPEEKIPQIIERAKRAGVERILTIGTDLNSSRKAWEISKSYEGVLLSVGIHPHDSEEVTEEDLESLYELAKKGEVVAIGETGLDFYRNYSPPEAQKRVFYAHIEMAKSLDLPLIIHSRKALNETYKILKEKRVENFVMHCFSGSVEEADFFLKLGGVISLAGPLTFKNARKPQKLAAKVPLSFLLLETDSPYLAPHPYRGKENEPCYLQFIARKLAEIKELSFEEVAEETSKNAFKIFSK
jgi:TatD DNase family protein